MLPPEWLVTCTDDIVELYEELNTSIIEDIVRRINRMGYISESSVRQAEILQQSGMLFDDIMKQVASSIGKREETLKNLFIEAGTKTLTYDDAIYRAAGLNPPPLNQSPSMLQILNATLVKTNRILNNLTLTSAVQSQRAFIDAVDLAYMQVSSGAMSYQQAIKNAIQKVAHTGASVRFPSGHIDKLDVAVRRSVLTGVNQSGLKLQYQRALDMGCELVETTAHAGARDDHIPWQGKVFSLKGKTKGYDDFESSTGYGTGAGLGGWNCRHGFHPFFEGLSERAYSDEDLRKLNEASVYYNGQEIPMYDATQIQREIERNIREYKREINAYDAALTSATNNKMIEDLKTEIGVASVKLKDKERLLTDFLKQSGLYRQADRQQALGFGRSLSQIAVHADKRHQYLTKELVGVLCTNGVTVSEVSLHYTARARARGIKATQLKDSLLSPYTFGIVRVDRTQTLIHYVTSSINVDTGVLTTIYKTHKRTLKKLGVTV